MSNEKLIKEKTILVIVALYKKYLKKLLSATVFSF